MTHIIAVNSAVLQFLYLKVLVLSLCQQCPFFSVNVWVCNQKCFPLLLCYCIMQHVISHATVSMQETEGEAHVVEVLEI